MRPRQAHYLKEWRESRGLTQKDLVPITGKSTATLSKVERHQLPYAQPVIEGYASALECTTADLLFHHPSAIGADRLLKVWARIRNRTQALRMLEALADNQDQPPDDGELVLIETKFQSGDDGEPR